MGFAALLADERVEMKGNISGRLFSSAYIDKLAKTLVGIFHERFALVLVHRDVDGFVRLRR